MASRIIFSSVQSMVMLLRKHPELYQISGFATLKAQLEKLPANIPGCVSCRGASSPLQQLSKTFEMCIHGLRAEDVDQIKSILKVAQVCYYSRNSTTHKLELTCR